MPASRTPWRCRRPWCRRRRRRHARSHGWACLSARQESCRPRARRRTGAASLSTRPEYAAGEQLDFASRALVEVHREAGLDGVHRGERRSCAARCLGRALRVQPGRRRCPRGDRRFCPADRGCGGARVLRPSRFAKAMAPSSRSPSITASTMPACAAGVAAIGLPSVHISSASAGPHKRGSLCVPPAPGIIPRCTSG